MNKFPFSPKTTEPEHGSIEWMIQEARRLGYVYADNGFLSWVDNRIGKGVGDLFRSCIVHTRQWMLRNGLPIGKIRLDDMISYVFMGIKRSAEGKMSNDGFAKTLASLKQSATFTSWFKGVGEELSNVTKGFSFSLAASTNKFKSWFKGSKAIQDNGEPMVLYHGTGSAFSVFKDMAWGSANPELASDYAELREQSGGSPNVMPIFMSIKDPFDADLLNRTIRARDFFEELANQSPKADKEELARLLSVVQSAARREESGPHYSPHNFWNGTSSLFGSDGAEAIRSAFEVAGFDGVKYHENGNLTFGAFSSSQVVSALAPELVVSEAANDANEIPEKIDTNSSEFKAFFKNSKVVDENGLPRVMFHGTDYDFTTFDTKRGAWFISDPVSAEEYGSVRVIDAYVSIQNPYVSSHDEKRRLGDNRLLEKAKRLGHDGIFLPTDIEMAKNYVYSEAESDVWIAFSPEQIKSATINNGQFNSNNPDIRFSQSGYSNTTEFKNWFGGSKVVDENNQPLVVYHGTKGNFSQFKTPAWFTPSLQLADSFSESMDLNFVERTPDSKVMSVYLRLENPVYTDNWSVTEPNKKMLEKYKEWEQQGHDGIIFSLDGEVEYIVFNPSQIKSAMDNNGDFDFENPDIRFSKSGEKSNPYFKRWFNNSKVVNKKGEPLVLFHGTDRDFTAFDKKFIGTNFMADEKGFFFTSSPKEASDYAVDSTYGGNQIKENGRVIPVFISLKNPLIIDPEFLEKEGMGGILGEGGREDTITFWDVYQDVIFEWVNERKSDGVIIVDPSFKEIDGEPRRMVVAFEPGQIKSAIGNNGKYNPFTPDILFSRAGVAASNKSFDESASKEILKNNQAFNKWIAGTKMVDDVGNPMVVYHGTGMDITEFKTEGHRIKSGKLGKGIYTTPSASKANLVANIRKIDGNPNVMPLFVSIKNPFEIFGEKNIPVSGIDRDKLKSHGYDGIILYSNNGETIEESVVFDPSQVKSAIGNSGGFNPENPDIRFSKSGKTSTSEFKEWFGNSKAVDEQGNPLIVYHGTAKDIKKFKAKGDRGYYFSSNSNVAETYAADKAKDGVGSNIMPVYLSLQNPLIVDGLGGHWAEIPFNGKKLSLDIIKQIALDLGHDGVIAKNIQDLSDMNVEDGVLVADTFVVFNQSQIKSAIGNTGEFNPENPDIRFSKSGKTSTSEFKEWFGRSKILDSDGNPLVVYHGTNKEFTEFYPSEGDNNHIAGIYFSRTPDRNGSNFSADYYIDNDRNGYIDGGRIIPVFLKIENPASYEYINAAKESGELASDAIGNEVTKFLIDKGFDGYVDDAEIIAFHPSQVKSSIGNTGAFNPENPDILFSRAAADIGYPLAEPGTRYEETDIEPHWMTPDEYLSKVRPLTIDDESRDSIDALKDHILSGRKLDPLVIYADGKEDGRHRAYASKELGINKVPVIIHAEPEMAKKKAFNEWFDESKVVDAEGNPLVVYHGTTASFSEFSMDFFGNGDGSADFGEGFYFTDKADAANTYAEGEGANVMPVYLRINNPATNEVMLSSEIQDVIDDGMGFEELSEVLEEMGYDGIEFTHKDGGKEYVVFNPNQIKSAIGNNGQYSNDDINILFSRSQYKAGNDFNEWFSGSKIIDKNGAPIVVYHGTKNEIDGFNESPSGIFFAKDAGAASAFAMGYDDELDGSVVYPVVLSIKNPLIVTDEWLNEFSIKAPKDPYQRGHSFRDDFVDSEEYARKAVIEEAKSLGFDGMILVSDLLPISHLGGDWEEQVSYVAFYSNQVRSFAEAEFSDNNDLNFSRSKTTNFNNPNGVVIDKNGQHKVVYHGTLCTKYTPPVTEQGSKSAMEELKKMAKLHGISDWTSVPRVLERWVDTAIGEEQGVTKQVADHARELLTKANSKTTQEAKVEIGFDEFEFPGDGKELGVHFGTKKQAETFGKAFAFHITMHNPIRLPDLGTWDYQSVIRELRKNGVSISEQEYDVVFNANDNNQALRDLMLSKGIDGVIYKNEAEGKGDSYIVLKNSQIHKLNEIDLRASFSKNSTDEKVSNDDIVLTENRLMIEVAKNFPRLVPAAETILERGREGKPGGAVIVSSNSIEDIANIIANKTGYSYENCLKAIDGEGGDIYGFYDNKTKISFIVGKGMSPERGVSILFHELTHGQQFDRINQAAKDLMDNRDDEPESTKAFLNRVEGRLMDTGEIGNVKEILPYIIEQAIMESIVVRNSSKDIEINNEYMQMQA